MSRYLSIQRSQQDLWDEAERNGKVYVKTENGHIVEDSLTPYISIRTFIYNISLTQETYGKNWALTREELENE